MRTSVVVAGILAGAALPLVVQAQPYDPGCVQSNHANNVAGTVVGGVAGAIIGGAIGGHANRGAGVAIGAATGAVAGNAIARSNDHPCPPGYYYPGPPPGPAGYFWRGAPPGVFERMDFLQHRIDESSARGWLSPGEYHRLSADLYSLRQQADRMRYRDGGHLYPADRAWLQDRLDQLSQRVHWETSY